MTLPDIDAYHDRQLTRYECEVDRASAEHDALEAALDAGGWDPSEAELVDWLESIAP